MSMESLILCIQRELEMRIVSTIDMNQMLFLNVD